MDIFKDLSFEKFKELAKAEGLSDSLRIGFPDNYRNNKELDILEDILSKTTNLKEENKTFLEIGPGSGALTECLLDYSSGKNHKVVFVDSQEMLQRIPNRPYLKKISSCFPENFSEIALNGPYDVILVYSVLQYPFLEGNVWNFLDKACELLAPGGQMLVGDIPNISMRKRFFSSPAGIQCHQEYTKKTEAPEVKFNVPETTHIDDGVLIGFISRFRSFGYHAFLVPQAINLPMANRREDMLIIKP